MTAHPEHALQVKVNQWVRECVPAPHFFCSVDRAAKRSPMDHVRQKAAGFVSGTPDTLLLVPGLPCIAVELKAGSNRPTEQQFRVGQAITIAGHTWRWCSSVLEYCRLLGALGVPLRPGAAVLAAHHDAVLAGAAIKREESRTGKPSAKRKPQPRFTASKAVVARARRAGVMP